MRNDQTSHYPVGRSHCAWCQATPPRYPLPTPETKPCEATVPHVGRSEPRGHPQTVKLHLEDIKHLFDLPLGRIKAGDVGGKAGKRIRTDPDPGFVRNWVPAWSSEWLCWTEMYMSRWFQPLTLMLTVKSRIKRDPKGFHNIWNSWDAVDINPRPTAGIKSSCCFLDGPGTI